MQKQVVNKTILTQFLGGPNIYTEEHGHPMLRKRHMAFTITEFERDAWLENMQTAIALRFHKVLEIIYLSA